MAESILTSTKKKLGLDESYTAFDEDIIGFINGVFSTLEELGIGPEGGFAITDKTTTWDAFYGTNKTFNSVQTYIFLCVRMLFDPPQTGYLVDAYKQQKTELEWRLNNKREMFAWTNPDGEALPDSTVLDGGAP